MNQHMLAVLSLLVVVVACPGAAASGPANAWDARAYGARADGRTLDTKAIQAAIDACAKAGGGTVHLTGGVFLSGTIRLRSQVTLSIASGATLRGSADIQDYESITPQINYLYRARFTKSLIYAEREENIALAGGGIIDGQGKLFPAKKGDDGDRPYLIRFSECRHVQVRGLTLLDSARWLSHYLACENVTIEGLTIRSPIRENRDGMDIDSCHMVRIAHCDVSTGDDAIVLKSTTGQPCRDVAVSDCTLSSKASALKLGTESQGGFADVTFKNCVVYDTRDGVSIEEVDGGTCERISVSNITMRNVQVPIFVRLGNRANPLPGQPKPGLGRMRDITITDLQASQAGGIGCAIAGLPDRPLENITLQNLHLRFVGGGTAEHAARVVPEKETAYPKGDMFGTLPAYGLYCRHVNGLRLQNLDLAFDEDEARSALVADDVADLDLFNVRAKRAPAAEGLICLRDVRGALIHGCQGNGPFLKVTGAKSRQIIVRDATKSVTQSADVPAGAISREAP